MMPITITLDEERIRQIYRLLADKLAVGDPDAVDLLTWLDAHIGRQRSDDQ